jgi:hypothetical protein
MMYADKEAEDVEDDGSEEEIKKSSKSSKKQNKKKGQSARPAASNEMENGKARFRF